MDPLETILSVLSPEHRKLLEEMQQKNKDLEATLKEKDPHVQASGSYTPFLD